MQLNPNQPKVPSSLNRNAEAQTLLPLLCQLVQPLQAVLDLCDPYQLPEILFCTGVSVESRMVNLHSVDSLNRPRFTSFRRDRKDGEYLDHNINDHVRHSRSRCNARVNLLVRLKGSISLSRLSRTYLVHSRDDPFREAIVAILGLIEPGGLFSKDGEDSLGEITGLKPEKERVRGWVLLSLTIVSFQSSVEKEGKVGDEWLIQGRFDE
jgi:hypothetical protein